MRVVVDRRQLEHLAELALGRGPVSDPEVRDPERFADRGLLGLQPARLFERHGRLRRETLTQTGTTQLVKVVCLTHRPIVPDPSPVTERAYREEAADSPPRP